MLDGEPVLAAELPAALEPAARALGDDRARRYRLRADRPAAPAPLADHRRCSAHARRDDPPRHSRRGGGARRRVRGRWSGSAERPARSARGFGSRRSWSGRGWRRGTCRRARARPKGSPSRRSRRCGRCRSGSIFAVGLDERVFPSAEGFGTLDLRAAARHPATSHRASRTSTCSSRRCWPRASGCICRTSARDAVTGEREDPSSALIALRDVPARRRVARTPRRAAAAQPG